MEETGIGIWGVPLAIFAGAIRVSTPFIFVSLGETITERSGRINLGLEGTLVFGAMTAYAVAVMTGSPTLGVLAAMVAGAIFGLIHGWICKFPKVNDIAIGIAMMQFGLGMAFFLGKSFIQPVAPKLPSIALGGWSSTPQIQAALNINVLFFIGAALALFLFWAFKNTRIGLILRVVGDSTDAARAMGINPDRVRLLATAVGGSLAAIGGAYLSLYYPGSWNEGISSGQGLMAVALVIFARWNPIGCFLAALLFGGAGALGPALQSVGVTQGYYLFYAAPYVLTLVILIATSSPTRSLAGAPGALSLTK
ncbi:MULTISPECIES: ABC transporter permease [Rhizobium]|uniref:Permease component of ABC transporter n=1 Tax=Rhizobium johnstonii (strain DSM 114642 / LMG 32736 / 3841) TaxID=216596 RepID=Q1M7F6_RHIJ3|nr:MULTISPECIES: ABC transporter permease [Rhizobium]MBB4509408.1 simple sugar transport system permease protein [Rhizobium leguminosarum]MBY5344781.1 ABC transporter permease [Rhizobium leguminosarum]MBY5376786.1 ABC transporter permease [Rhizobium leguminosarum]MBY5391684.1 ABC transporter permease [Rhizobium leguminosarum]MBY5416250.1 ABC transporter permease [Rhizobium leguminosarum]